MINHTVTLPRSELEGLERAASDYRKLHISREVVQPPASLGTVYIDRVRAGQKVSLPWVLKLSTKHITPAESGEPAPPASIIVTDEEGRQIAAYQRV